MKLEDNTINITIKLHISLWDALKMRLAGIPNLEEIKQIGEEAEGKKYNLWDIRRNKDTGLIEVLTSITEEFCWDDYDTSILGSKLGMCPKCNVVFPLLAFRERAEVACNCKGASEETEEKVE